VAWLFYVRDLTYAEIAERLGMTLGSVKCLGQRARVALKRAWEAEGKLAFATT
jgi:DNA-directed RNA polymerase specialized sigma24 family protein